jgi:hypothetical protein
VKRFQDVTAAIDADREKKETPLEAGILVGPEGVEPSTAGLRVHCSTN